MAGFCRRRLKGCIPVDLSVTIIGAVESGLQRVVSVVVTHELFS